MIVPDADVKGWPALLRGHPWLSPEGSFPLPAYSEFMPPPRLGRGPYGSEDPVLFTPDDPFGWHVSEIEEEYELRPGLAHVALQIVGALVRLGRGEPVPAIAGHEGANLKDNPYWPPELASSAADGRLDHERYVTLLPLSLSRTQDDKGRVRWTLFGASEQGPEEAFWKSFSLAPGIERPEKDALSLVLRILVAAYGLSLSDPGQLGAAGFRILPSSERPLDGLPAWTRPLAADGSATFDKVRFLLTFEPFGRLPASVRTAYLAGRLNLLPFPGSLVFWGMPTFRALARELPLAMQIPLLPLAARHGGPEGLRVSQSGWLHEPRPDADSRTLPEELAHDRYLRTNRWDRVHRYEDELLSNPRSDRTARVLFSTSLESLGLYDKPMARNCQLWTRDFRLLLDGPNAGRDDLRRAETELVGGGVFGYRFFFPPMRVGRYEVYWHRPLVAFISPADGTAKTLDDCPLGFLTAYRLDAVDPMHSLEFWPRLLDRGPYLAALRGFEHGREHYRHETALNILSLLDGRRLNGGPLPKSLARDLLRVPSAQTLDGWLGMLAERADTPALSEAVRRELNGLIDSNAPALPQPITFGETATRVFEEGWWSNIAALASGRYLTKDNADVVLDSATQDRLVHHERDLDRVGDFLLIRHRRAIAEAGAEDRAFCGELPFSWRTDFDFAQFGGWKKNQARDGEERNILVVIPGRDRSEAIVLADHYDTAYMEDVFYPAEGGSGARMAARGADDNGSATATLLAAAPVFLKLANAGRLERDVWLLHLTGEEFPSDCLGARSFCRSLVEGGLRFRLGDGSWRDVSSTRVRGVLVMDMIAHNRDDDQDVFQISPGRGAESFRLAAEAHLANMTWNALAPQWNKSPERMGKGRGRRSPDGKTMPAIALHPHLQGEVRTVDDPLSSLYNTDGQIFSDVGVPVILFMENYDIKRTGYHDSHDTLENIDLDYGSAVAAMAIETVARLATLTTL